MCIRYFVINLFASILMFSAVAGSAQAGDAVDNAVQSAAEALASSAGIDGANPKNVAVSALVSLGPTAREKQLGEVFAELLQDKMSKIEGLKLIERLQLKKILAELKLSLLGLSDPTNAGAVGQMAGADIIIVGSVSEVGADFVMALRMVEVSTGRINKAFKIKIPRDGMIAMSSRYLVVRTKSDAVFRSLLVPGWGQMFNQDVIRGALYTSVFAGTLIGAGASYLMGEQARKDYDAAKVQADMDKAASNYKTRRQLMNVFLIGTGAIWAVNVLDAAVTGVERSEVKSNTQISTNLSKDGVLWDVAWKF